MNDSQRARSAGRIAVAITLRCYPEISMLLLMPTICVVAFGTAMLIVEDQVPTTEDDLWIGQGRGTHASIPYCRRGQWGYLDCMGREVILPQYRSAGQFVFGRAVVDEGIIDASGELLISLSSSVQAVILCEDNFWYCTRERPNSEAWGLMDFKGRVLLKEAYADVRPFSEGIAAVNRGAELRFPGIMEGGTWGYVSRDGAQRIQFSFEFAGPFSEDRAVVRRPAPTPIADDLHPEFQVIDHKGEVVFEGAGWPRGSFSQGLLAIYRPDETTYFNQEGKPQFSIRGRGNQFSEGRAVFSRTSNSKCVGAIDTSGQIIFEFESEGLLGRYQSGRASLSNGRGKIGFVDTDGKTVIPYRYNAVNEFNSDIAVVHRGGLQVITEDAGGSWFNGVWVLIDCFGRELAVTDLDPKAEFKEEANMARPNERPATAPPDD